MRSQAAVERSREREQRVVYALEDLQAVDTPSAEGGAGLIALALP